ncbi:MAG: flagellar biosynthetic protein FliO [Caulobacterales bacterium]|jgi:flagellar protein FliO/FliZ
MVDWLDWARALFALIATLGLIVGAALVARRLGMLQPRAGGVDRRLAMTESLMLDPRRRLVLVRLDDREHLILLSPAGDRAITSQPMKAPPPPAPSEESAP